MGLINAVTGHLESVKNHLSDSPMKKDWMIEHFDSTIDYWKWSTSMMSLGVSSTCE
jgi:hypothetical protein